MPPGWTPRPFRPAWWLPGRHAQTLVGRLLRARAAVPFRRRRISTPDGDVLDLDVRPAAGGREGASEGPTRGVCLLLHGLQGSSRSGYMVEACRLLAEAGFEAVALNFRSRGGEPNLRRRFYHSGETGDLRHVLEWLARRRGDVPVVAAGFSLGGNVLLKFLGERGAEAREHVDAAAAVSVPFDLSASADRMETGFGRVYAALFLRSLRRSVREKARRGHRYDLEAVERAGSLREFDDAFTAPVHGFRGAEDYYRRSSSRRFLSGIRVPTLLLHARDDPFLPAAAIPREQARRNPWIRAAFPDRGGHIGFVEGTAPWRPRFWAEREVVRWLRRAAAPGVSGRGPGSGDPRGDDEEGTRVPRGPGSGDPRGQ